jgi:hypothetical protein
METVTPPDAPAPDLSERLRAIAGRVAFRTVIVGLSSGIALQLLHQPYWASRILEWTCGVLIGLPVVNVLGVMWDEIRRRDWIFALLAAAVILLLGYALIKRLGGAIG